MLAGIEESGTQMYEAEFGDLTGDPLAAPAQRGGDRADRPGFLLVVGAVGDPVGFVHVEVIDGFAHLAQLSVRPEAGRRGLGTALVRAAMREAYLLGFDRLSLTTFRDVPWNAAFYRSLGFAEEAHPMAFEVQIRAHEVKEGLDRHQPRIVMSVAL